MYTQFYGLREKPFSLSPDPRYLFLADPHREALAHLLYGIEQGEGFICITGEVGTGKTTLCRTLLQRLDPSTEVAFIFNPQLTDVELVQAINAELGLEVEGLDRRQLIDQLNRFLLERKADGRRVLLIVDEAQVMERDALEQIRLLSNLETNTAKLIQIVLIGQPELDTMLESPDLRQLRQRISVRWRLEPLSVHDAREYVRHRLRIAAGGPRELFTDLALREIHRRSGGIPRLINLLCDRSLLAGYAAGAEAIGLGLVTETDREVRVGAKTRPRRTGGWRPTWRPTLPSLPRLRLPQALRLSRPRLPDWVQDGAPLWIGAGLLGLVLAGWLILDPLSGLRDEDALPTVASPPPSIAPAAEVNGASGRSASAAADGEALVFGPERPPVSSREIAPTRVAAHLDEARNGQTQPTLDGRPAAPSGTPATNDDGLWKDLPPPDELAALGADLGTTLGRSSPAVTIAGSLDVMLLRWSQPLLHAELLSLPQMVSNLRERGFSVLNLRDARLETLAALDLPALIVLRAMDGAPRYAALTGMGPDTVRLEGIGPTPLSVGSEDLEPFWQGEAFVPWRDFETLPSVLRPGTRGPHVEWLQTALLQLGVYRAGATGRYDANTVAGVRAIQERLDLSVDGTVGPVTKIQLYRALPGYAVPDLQLRARGSKS